MIFLWIKWGFIKSFLQHEVRKNYHCNEEHINSSAGARQAAMNPIQKARVAHTWAEFCPLIEELIFIFLSERKENMEPHHRLTAAAEDQKEARVAAAPLTFDLLTMKESMALKVE